MMNVNLTDESWLIRGTFTISRGSRTHANVVVVELQQDQYIGRGECVPYARYGESIESVLAELNLLKDQIENGLTRQEMQSLLPAGAARNALDCAYWDSACKTSEQRIWQQLEMAEPKPLINWQVKVMLSV